MLVKMFALACSLFVINVVNANWPPSADGYVYRFDTRPPLSDAQHTGIFTSGFMPHGENLSLLDHISGRSTVHRTSAWVSTTETLQLAEAFATSFLTHNPRLRPQNGQPAGHIYRILPSDNFYSMNYILDNVQIREPSYSTEIFEQARNLRQVFGMQREWAALYGIPRTLIREAIPVYWVNNAAVARPELGLSNANISHSSHAPSDPYHSLSAGAYTAPVAPVAAIPTHDSLIDLGVLTEDDWRAAGVDNNTDDLISGDLHWLEAGAMSLSFDPFQPDCNKRTDACSTQSEYVELNKEGFDSLRLMYLRKVVTGNTLTPLFHFFLF